MRSTGTKAENDRVDLIFSASGRQSGFSLSLVQFRFAIGVLFVLVAGFAAQSWLLIAGRGQVITPERADTYQRRVAGLQSQLERVSSRQVLDADLIERRIVQIAARQAELEAQGDYLTRIAAQTLPEGVTQVPQSRPARTAVPVPLPVPLPPARPQTGNPVADTPAEEPPLRLRRLEGALKDLETRNLAALEEIARRMKDNVRGMDAALAAAGLRIAPGAPPAAMGGPLIPLHEGLAQNAFARKLRQMEPLLVRHAQLSAVIPGLPLRAPLPGAFEVTSPFGPRNDPFYGRAAWHAGNDLRDDAGSDVLATGAGRVTSAGWNGAYGLTVDIDHGNGLASRYAHLASLQVREGQMVAAQAVLGRMGSTGRSTGAHLHYEIRIDDKAVDPMRFLRAGENLASLAPNVSRMREAAQ